MITSEQAEALAKQYVADYVTSCCCQTPEDMANVLMKMTSVCGVFMCATVGHVDAVARMQGATDFIKESLASYDEHHNKR